MTILGLNSGMFAFCVFSFLAGLYIFSHGLSVKSETSLFKGACIVLGLAYMAITISTTMQLEGLNKYFGGAPTVETTETTGAGSSSGAGTGSGTTTY